MAHATGSNPYILNPYDRDILPGTTTGGKLYMNAIAEEKDEANKFSLSTVAIHDLRNALSSAASKYGWGALMNAIPT